MARTLDAQIVDGKKDMSDQCGGDTERCTNCDSDNVKMVVRARENEFGTTQIFKCRECGRRFPI